MKESDSRIDIQCLVAIDSETLSPLLNDYDGAVV